MSRKNMLLSAEKVMESYASHRAVLELEYFGEVGTGLGPTLEFYTLLSHELQRKGLAMWRSDTGKDSEAAAAQGTSKDLHDIASKMQFMDLHDIASKMQLMDLHDIASKMQLMDLHDIVSKGATHACGDGRLARLGPIAVIEV